MYTGIHRVCCPTLCEHNVMYNIHVYTYIVCKNDTHGNKALQNSVGVYIHQSTGGTLLRQEINSTMDTSECPSQFVVHFLTPQGHLLYLTIKDKGFGPNSVQL